MLPGLEKTIIWAALVQIETLLIIGEHREECLLLHLLVIGISCVNGSMVMTMYGGRVLVGSARVFFRQIVTAGDGFGSNFTVILSRFTFLWLLVDRDKHQYQ
ncbi:MULTISPECIES: hypothetical protein [unclassified Microcoleus]|uniref:hypothetical protein n=2 Tax=Microcoleus TaxID=44471 RepID=UPI002FD78D9C